MRSIRQSDKRSFVQSAQISGRGHLSSLAQQWLGIALAKDTLLDSSLTGTLLDMLAQGKSPVVSTSWRIEHGTIRCRTELFDASSE
jgi:hypothetical protein